MATGGLGTAQTLDIFFGEGLPNPSGGLAAISLNPVIIELADQEWSAYGSIMYFHIAGIGPDD